DTIEPVTPGADTSASTFTVAYDRRGLPDTEISPGGFEVTRTFDELGRTVSETGTGPGGAVASRSFGWDLAGRRTRVDHPGGEVGFEFDDRGLLTGTTSPAGDTTYRY